MAAPPLAAATRYTSQGVTKVYWVPTIASISSPTRSELNAGTDISGHVIDRAGWSVNSTQIDTPDLANRYTTTIPGVIKAISSSLTVYMSKNGVDARTLMPRDTIGYIVWLDGGDTTGYKADVYPVTVSSVSKMREVKGALADNMIIEYAITSQPAENVSVPA